MRTAMITAIYKKTLSISNIARKDFSTGEITNLMSVDAQRFMEIIPYVNSLWSGPFQFALAIYFLYNLIGVSAFVGLAVFAVLIPINIYGGRYMRATQSEQMKAKDKRILFMNEVLQGMKVVKLYAWETPFMAKIKEHRDIEIKMILKKAILQAVLWITYTAAPLIVTLSTFACYVSLDENNILTAEKVFGTVSIFNVVRIPMNQFPNFVMESVKLYVSLRRIEKFLGCDDLESNEEDANDNTDRKGDKVALELRQADFSWQGRQGSPTLKNIDFSVNKGELIAVVGKIGSGKSSLLAALLGEMNKIRGAYSVNGRVSYVAQQAWIQNLTVKDNILFGSGFDSQLYKETVDACALRSDLEILPSGDETEIGENGVNLSGGQKQRIGLARAAYCNADIVLMDDPLSAVDAHVAKHIFENLIGPKGLLSGRTRILVTNNLGFLHKVDRILLFSDGEIVDNGSLEELQQRKNKFFAEMSQFVGKDNESEQEVQMKEAVKQVKKSTSNGKLIEKEKSAEGRVSVKHYWFYIKAMNPWLFLLTLFYFLAAEAFKVAGNLVLADWTDNFSPDSNLYYLGMYTLMAIICSITGMLSQINCNNRCAAASVKLHESLLDRTMHAPLSFFETNPIGRILNRFTSDLDVADMKIPNQLRMFISCVFMILGTYFVVSSITPWFLLPLVPIILAFIFLQVYYTRTRRQTKRMESVAKSPIFSHFTETITGATTIRAFGQEKRFYQESEGRVSKHLVFNYIR